MSIKFNLLAILLFLFSFTSAQNNLPLIYANSTSVDILEGGKIKKEAWTISPDIKPDIYITEISNNKITF